METIMEGMGRWSRGCGTGIGLSGNKNQYRLGVAIENWVRSSFPQDSNSPGRAATAKALVWSMRSLLSMLV